MSNFVNLLDIVYPVGSIYQSMSKISPADIIGGTWTQIKTFLYGADTANQTGGEATHTLTVDEMPSHGHGIVVAVINGGNATTYRTLFATNYPAWNNGNPDSNNAAKNTGGGASTQQLAAIHNLLHLVQNSIALLKTNCLNLSEVAYV